MAEPKEPLTERELQIVQLLATGASNKEIGAQLFLSPNTVKVHLRNIFTKLEVQTRTEATMVAVRNGWVAVSERSAISNQQSAEEQPLPKANTIVIEA
ncbi:MAG: response regulator transcription factor, partial [Anaerolineae bacterium]|nr:response regulator transcription factor [Anaerolineae bacterium]